MVVALEPAWVHTAAREAGFEVGAEFAGSWAGEAADDFQDAILLRILQQEMTG